MTNVVAHYSGGLSSHLAAHRACEEFGANNVTLLFADTRTEDADSYRFIAEGAEALGARLETVCDGRDIWQVMKDERFLGNSRVAPCTKILKQRQLNRWCAANAPDAIHVIGYTSCETGRQERFREESGYANVRFMLGEPPTISKLEVLPEFVSLFPGIAPPRLYLLGSEHNNCGGACVKAGHKHYLWLLTTMPEKYAEWESKEEDVRQFLERDDVSILKDRRGGISRPITLRQFRERVEQGKTLPLFERSIACMC